MSVIAKEFKCRGVVSESVRFDDCDLCCRASHYGEDFAVDVGVGMCEPCDGGGDQFG